MTTTFNLDLYPTLRALGLLEGHLEDAAAKREAIETRDGKQRLVVVGHCNEAVALALARLVVANDLQNKVKMSIQYRSTVYFIYMYRISYDARFDVKLLNYIRPRLIAVQVIDT